MRLGPSSSKSKTEESHLFESKLCVLFNPYPLGFRSEYN